MSEIPLVGQQPSEEEKTLLLYIQTLEAFIRLHQMHVRNAEGELNREYSRAAASESKTINGLYTAMVEGRMATHCAAITQATGHLALLAAMGVQQIPMPPGVEIDEGKPN